MTQKKQKVQSDKEYKIISTKGPLRPQDVDIEDPDDNIVEPIDNLPKSKPKSKSKSKPKPKSKTKSKSKSKSKKIDNTNKIFDTLTKTYISPKTAKDRGIKNNLRRFEIPANHIILRVGNSYQLKQIKDVRDQIKEGSIKLNQIIGDYELNESKRNITRNPLSKKTIKQNIDTYDVVRYVVDKMDHELSRYYALYNFLKKKVGIDRVESTPATFIVAMNGRIVLSEDINTTGYAGFRDWWDTDGFKIGLVDSNDRRWEAVDVVVTAGNNRKKIVPIYHDYDNHVEFARQYMETTVVFYWVPKTELLPDKSVYQSFRENEKNTCFFDVIETYMNELEKNEKCKINVSASLGQIAKLKEIYKNGVRDEDIQTICNTLVLNIEIYDIMHNKYLQYSSKKKSHYKTIKYINTRFNHVDEYIDNSTNVNLIADKNEMVEKLKDTVKNGELLYYKGSISAPREIYTHTHTYKYDDKINDQIREFNNNIGLNNFRMTEDTQKELIEFIKQGVNYNSHCAFKVLQDADNIKLEQIENDPEYIEYDMKRAYTQYTESKYYIGFPNMMTPVLALPNFNIDDIRNNVGYYKVKITKIEDLNAYNIFNELGLMVGSEYVLSSPELLIIHDHGVKYVVICGSYSFKPFMLNLPEDWTTEENKKSKIYGNWAGKLNSYHTENLIKTICTKDMANVLSCEYKNVRISKYDGEIFNMKDNIECQIAFKVDNPSYLGHIGGYVTAYTRCNVLEQLLKIKHCRIIGFKLDGFIVKGHITELQDNPLWSIKKTKCVFNWGDVIFKNIVSRSIFHNNQSGHDRTLFKSKVSLLSGAGGFGKTYSVLNMFKDTLYVSGCWSLINNIVNDYNVKGLTYHRVVGLNCEKYFDRNKHPTRILIDEITMIDKKHLKKIIKMFPYSQILLCGDVDHNGFYQCDLQDVEVMKVSDIKNLNVIEYTKPYRFKDPELVRRLEGLRREMVRTNFDTALITKYFKNEFKDRAINEKTLKETYNYKTDTVLCSTIKSDDSQVKYYTELLNGKKYICVQHSQKELENKLQGDLSVVLKGDIVIDIEPTKKYERRDAFTIHSYQGKTIKNPSKLFINTSRVFCPRQLYTAVSRVEYLDQIFYC